MTSSTKHTSPSGKPDDLDYYDPIALGQILMDVSQQVQPLFQEFFKKNDFDITNIGDQTIDPLNIREAYTDFMTQLANDPQKFINMQIQFWTDWTDLWQDSAKRFVEGDITQSKDDQKPKNTDRRFKSDAWQQSALFDFIKQSYLMTSHFIENMVDGTEGMDTEAKRKVSFYTRQFVDAMAPSNFLFTNPEVLDETIKTKGENLVKGMKSLLEDMERGHGELKISTTNYSAFELGKNIATTKGKVMYQNDLMQLIQYEPTTPKVHKRPMLIIPPWINKYYILDLREENSFVKWFVDQGHTVFILSWVNPDKKLAGKTFEDYMTEGIFDALDQIKNITGEPDVNAIGYCLGGTLLTIALAYMAAQKDPKQKDRIASACFLTTLVDFEKAGDLKLFIDEAQITMMEKSMKEKGFLDADHFRKTFSMLRSNDMVWSFVVNNYLMGREPFPFDLLYWNDDATNMPAAMHSFYLRNCYQNNLLKEPGGITMKDTPIDVRSIKTPCYFLSAKEDHIAPWDATYATTQMVSGPKTFTLSASGHVAGVVNPPAKNKYCFWTSSKQPATPEDWLQNAKQHDGSWWTDYNKWVSQYGDEKVPARKIGEGKLKPIEDAPGSYAKKK